jgi:hypothetical protein
VFVAESQWLLQFAVNMKGPEPRSRAPPRSAPSAPTPNVTGQRAAAYYSAALPLQDQSSQVELRRCAQSMGGII